MKSTTLFVESLEPRVAPAILVDGGNLLGGAGNPTTGEASSGGNTVTLIKVLSGQALVFYDHGAITSISVGKHTRLDITGNILGDIVTNLLPDGRLTDSDNNPANGEDGGILLNYTIKGITTHPLSLQTGSLGRIIAGGSVKNVNVAGTVDGIYAGDGIFRDGDTATVSTGTVDYNTIVPGVQDTFTLTHAAALPTNANSIKNVVVGTANQLEIFAGSGSSSTTGAGIAGGSISNVTITQTLTGQGTKPALFLHAGDGGAGIDGGVGGSITNFDDKGSVAYVKVQTGDGGAGSTGDGGAGSTGEGGEGGSLLNSSISTSSPRYDLLMGHGGNGDTGGKGGSISSLNFTNDITGGQSLIASGDFNGDGIQDVLLINTITGEGVLSLGTGKAATPYNVALQSVTKPDGSVGVTPFIAAEGAVPTSVVTTDLNGDGHLDFVVSYASTNDLGVFLGHGDGTFTASAVALPASPTRIVEGDFSGSTAPDIAVLSSGGIAALTGGQNSEVFIAQGDGTGALTVLPNPVTISGVGTGLAAAQIDNVGGTDLFVGLQSGSIDPLFANGTSFTVGAPIAAFANGPVSNLDVDAQNGSVLLLAFSKNINANDPSLTTVTPQVNVIPIKADGTAKSTLTITPDAGSTAAHFIAGTDLVGVVNPAAVAIYGINNLGVYTVVNTLGSDGVLSDFSGAEINGVDQVFAVGAATNRFFYSSGVIGSATGLPALQDFDIPYEDRIISFTAGDGGTGGSHNGGAGGTIKAVTYTQTLGGGVLEAGGDYNTYITTGTGGASTGGTGGAGGELKHTFLSLNPGYVNIDQDDTDFAFLLTGAGGIGATGGAGGDLNKITSNSVFSQASNSGVILGAVALQLETGDGGAGTVLAGGAGGKITMGGPSALSGVTFYDIDSLTPEAPALYVEAGNGGTGVTAGGAGGSIANLGAQNATVGDVVVRDNELSSADISAGRGGDASAGDAGPGGAVTGLNVSVQESVFQQPDSSGIAGGWLTATGGAGGTSANGHGGAGGGVSKSTVASAQGDSHLNFGVLVAGGAGGSGTLGGGAGGGVRSLVVNSPSQSDLFAAVVAAGNGGDATVSGAGGDGGGVKGISQSKDVDSAINAILGGSGGTSVGGGTGGNGGSVKGVNTVGFIGLPSNDATNLGVFNTGIDAPLISSLFSGGEISQGIFAGRGASGAANGSVSNIVARQIAAIGAVVDDQGLFGVAAAVNNVKADLIGYEVNRDNVFESTAPGDVSPSTAVPVDGFILATAVSDIQTLDNARTTAFSFNG